VFSRQPAEPDLVPAIIITTLMRTDQGIAMNCSATTTLAKSTAMLLAIAALAWVSTSPADAKGCLKGAVVGGVAGHYAGHHGVLGAAAGCLYGRHRANEQDRQQQQQSQGHPSQQDKL
jgi:hypothetical protein